MTETETPLNDALQTLHPTPAVSDELYVRAFQAATRRHKPRVWPWRLAVAGAALVACGGLVIGQRLRLVLLYLSFESPSPFQTTAVGTELDRNGKKSHFYTSAALKRTLTTSHDTVTEATPTRYRTYYRHWNWVVESVPSKRAQDSSVKALQLYLNPEIRLEDRVFSSKQRQLTMTDLNPRSGTQVRYSYVPQTGALTETEVQLMPYKAPLQTTWYEQASEEKAQRPGEAEVPGNPPTYLVSALRQRLLSEPGTSFPITSKRPNDGTPPIVLLRADINAKGELFYLRKGLTSSAAAAVDDQGRRYLSSGEVVYWHGWYETRTHSAAGSTWLMPLDSPSGKKQPKTITLFLGSSLRQSEAGEFWKLKDKDRSETVTVPFPQRTCTLLPDWTPALDFIPESPQKLENSRRLTQAEQLFHTAATDPATLRRTYDTHASLLKYLGAEGKLRQAFWLSRIYAEEGKPEQAHRALEPVLFKGNYFTGKYLDEYRGVAQRCPKWAAACGDLWRAHGFVL